jgi:uroporphyrinogen III methyltransferase / synthase
VIPPNTKELSQQPLRGWRVVVTRPRSQSSSLDEFLQELGADVILLPTIEIADPRSFDPLDAALRGVSAGDYEWTLFLSVNAVRQVVSRLEAMSLEPTVISRSRVAAVGRATRDALSAVGVATDLVPETSSAAAMASALGRGKGKVLVPRAAQAPAGPIRAMRAQGWEVDEVVAYKTVPAEAGEGLDAVRGRQFDVVTFSSGSSVQGFAALVSPAQAGLSPDDPEPARVACIGPATARVAVELGFRVDAVAIEQSAAGLAEAVLGLREAAGSLRRPGMAP